MENKINLAELLKDCPKGMELYSPIFGEVYLDKIRPHLAIVVTTDKEQGDFKEEFLYDGRYGMKGECMLFPSKENRDWSKFQRPFKDGDILAYNSSIGTSIFIHRNKPNEHTYKTSLYVGINSGGDFLIYNKYTLVALNGDSETRLATEEEKSKLFQAIKDNGYKWNDENKTLEKLVEPIFNIGDKIKKKDGSDFRLITIESINNNYYIIKIPDWFDNCYITDKLPFNCQDEYELAHRNKFDINTLKSFESRVLARDAKEHIWVPAIWGCYDNTKTEDFPYKTIGSMFKYCIPYEGNEHLLGTTDDCDEYFKSWNMD